MNHSAQLTVVGLGPGDASLLTVDAQTTVARATEVWLRTTRHPTVSGLPAGPRYESFDDIYEEATTFDQVYDTIVARVLALAQRPEGVVYAVPGHPLVGESTVREILRRAPDLNLSVRIVPGLSFLDVIAPALALDLLADGLLVIDALSLGDKRRLLVPERPTVIAQIYDQRAASRAKLALLDCYPPHHPVRIVRSAGTEDVRVTGVALEALDREAADFDHLTSLYVPAVMVPEDVRSFEGLRSVVAKLRAPEGGCPWDLEQTHATLKRFLLEEAYEALDALDEGRPGRIAEELGDLLMQVVLHAQVAEDSGEFAIEDVIGAIAAKLVRRHPHVFGELAVTTSQEVLRNWDELKKSERGDAPLLDAVPKAMPALAQARSVQQRASTAGLHLDRETPPPFARVLTEVALAGFDAVALGELLFEIVFIARERDIDAEESLRMAVRRFRDGVSRLEAIRSDTSANG